MANTAPKATGRRIKVPKKFPKATSRPIKVAKKGRLDYNKCTFEELQRFVAARGLKHSVKHTRNAARELIITLQRADDDATFPFFLDLTPELRNRIYDELLVFDADTGFAHPQILASCSQVHNEASGIMCFKNVARVRLELGIMPKDHEQVDYKLSLSGPFAHESTTFLDNLCTGPIMWPGELRNFEHVSVEIHFRYGQLGGQRVVPRNRINAAVATLATFLQESFCLKRVTVNGDFDNVLKEKRATAAELAALLYPLSRICATAKFDCVFTGFEACPEVVQTLIDNANAHHDFYRIPFLRKLSLVALETNCLGRLGERWVSRGMGYGLISEELEFNIRAMTAELMNVSIDLFDNIEEEKKLKECADRAAVLYDTFAKTGILDRKAAHQKKYDPSHSCASCDFHRAHTRRIEEFPE